MGLEDFLGASLTDVLARSPQIGEAARRRVAEWAWASSGEPLSTPFSVTTFIVVDTETSGLNVRHDRLLSIGACKVRYGGVVAIGESFYREVRQEEASDHANILVHGIGRQAQLAGEREADALSAFLEFAGKHPLAAFNAPFDAEFLQAAMLNYLGVRFRPHWVDLAELPKAMFPTPSLDLKTLDDWLGFFGIEPFERHNALADAYATAQLFMIMLAKARHEGYSTLRSLKRAERYHHWQRH
jgi:DNA polymerase-3 subunit epsilon